MFDLASIPPIILVAIGGGVGAALRYLVGLWMQANAGGSAAATFIVNVLGGLAIGLLVGWLALRGGRESNDGVRLLLGVGLLGGFTTFSAFSLELFQMISRGEARTAGAYALASVAGGVLAVLVGVWLARMAS